MVGGSGAAHQCTEVAGIDQTEEWFKIPGESLKPRDGYYDLRITAELWETYYIDHYSLMVVDHPEGTEIFTDERFCRAAARAEDLFDARCRSPFASAHDEHGQDVSAVVRDLDRNYLDTFGRGPLSGLDARPLGGTGAAGKRSANGRFTCWGWLAASDRCDGQYRDRPEQHPAAGGPQHRSSGCARQVESCAQKALGFPAGKMKTVVLDLNGIFRPAPHANCGLRTNLEIYWDQLQWAVRRRIRITSSASALESADMRYRGFSLVKPPNPSSPELPDYNKIVSTGQIWHDLEGYYDAPRRCARIARKDRRPDGDHECRR